MQHTGKDCSRFITDPLLRRDRMMYLKLKVRSRSLFVNVLSAKTTLELNADWRTHHMRNPSKAALSKDSAELDFLPESLIGRCRRLIQSYHRIHGYSCLPNMSGDCTRPIHRAP